MIMLKLMGVLQLCLFAYMDFTSVQCFRLSGVPGSRKLTGYILISVHPDLSVWDFCEETYMWQDKTVFLVYRGNHIKS